MTINECIAQVNAGADATAIIAEDPTLAAWVLRWEPYTQEERYLAASVGYERLYSAARAAIDKRYAARNAMAVSAPEPEQVKCSCGHTVPRGSVMHASLGTSCPDCYDRMSDEA